MDNSVETEETEPRGKIEDKTSIERGRMRTRTAAFLILLGVLCSAVFMPPDIVSIDSKDGIFEALKMALGMIIVFYFKRQED